MERQYTAWGIMRALLIAQLMLVLFGVVAAFAEKRVGIIIYSKTGGLHYSVSELRRHELGHLLCPEWKHPPMLKGNGKLYMPPAACFNRTLAFELIEVPVSMNEARARCKGDSGCAYVIKE